MLFFPLILLKCKSAMKLWITSSLILCSIIKEVLGKSACWGKVWGWVSGVGSVNAGGCLLISTTMRESTVEATQLRGAELATQGLKGVTCLSPWGFSLLGFQSCQKPVSQPGKHFVLSLSIHFISISFCLYMSTKTSQLSFSFVSCAHFFELGRGDLQQNLTLYRYPTA